ncbi:hypothetical protein QAD02_017980 [Eretmocerus hayati]|uniref:Uncharacterized protein n=1 Tax=Eretmocerus hayati TaxID=131215 RepID=A0ACC2PGJ4_9HYME|nr:hypothetical protein QAD02_017980 [Eretmocerus hayati]
MANLYHLTSKVSILREKSPRIKTPNEVSKKAEDNQAIQENSSEVVEYDQVGCQCQGGNCKSDLEGRKIIHLKTLGANSFCRKCESIPSLVDVKSEKHMGLASILYTQCRNCSSVTAVNTDKLHATEKKLNNFDVNTKAVMGISNLGMRNLHFNKILAGFNIPQFQFTTMRTYKREDGNMIEEIARDSCDDAVLEERRLIIENAEKLKVLCHPPDDHSCRLNFVGSAKSMEPEAAVRVTRNNESLKKHNFEIGNIVADNDSSALLAQEKYQIIK